jgi:hypothetical protein
MASRSLRQDDASYTFRPAAPAPRRFALCVAVVTTLAVLAPARPSNGLCCICERVDSGAAPVDMCSKTQAFTCASCPFVCQQFGTPGTYAQRECCDGETDCSGGNADNCSFILGQNLCIQSTPGLGGSCDGACAGVAPPTATPSVTQTASATGTPTATPTAMDTPTTTPTRTLVPGGGSCTVTAQCETGLACVDNVCTTLSALAPATSSAGLLVGLGLLTAVGVLAIFRRRGASTTG